jgi:hypothetical protein
MMSLTVHFKSQNWKVLFIMDNTTTRSLRHVGSGETLVFNLIIEQYYY